MIDIRVKKLEKSILIEWQSAEINILLEEIIAITTSNSSLKKLHHAVLIGNVSFSKERIIIKTQKFNYILFTSNSVAILKEINI